MKPIFYNTTNPRLHLHDQYTISDMYNAYYNCIKHKQSSKSFAEFHIRCHEYLSELLDAINSETYEVSPLYHFVVTWPKAREVWASQFKDRIIHHLLYNDLGDFYISRFIDTNCACIKNRGTKYALDRTRQYCRSITQNWHDNAYVLKFDISNFFVSINKDILWQLIEKSLNYKDCLTTRLFKKVLYKNPVINAEYRGNPALKEAVPPHKRLANAKYHHGLPIGDLTSQLCASGIYLDTLDKYIKHTLKCKRYVRYVDDGIVLDKDSKRLEDVACAIKEFLHDKLELELSDSKTTIRPIKGGFDFIGAVILPHRTYLKNRIMDKITKSVIKIMSKSNEHYIDSINSYMGMLRTTDSFNIRKNACNHIFINNTELVVDMKTFTKVSNKKCHFSYEQCYSRYIY